VTDTSRQNAGTAKGSSGQEMGQGRGLSMRADRLLEYSVYNPQGQLLGDAERVVRDGDGVKVVIGHGGFLGMGEKQIAIPIRQLHLSGNRLVIRGMTDQQIQSMPEWQNASGATDVSDEQRVTLGRDRG